MKTKERILDTALRLFNESGTKAITTNHIAEAMGISPGNLYYHYANKESIIRDLAGQMADRASKVFDVSFDQPLMTADLMRMARQNYEIAWAYRFIYRELIALLNHDPELKTTVMENRRRAFADFQPLFWAFVEWGVLRPPAEPLEIDRLAELAWMMTEFWLPAVELGGREVTEREIDHGLELLVQLLRPYLNSTFTV